VLFNNGCLLLSSAKIVICWKLLCFRYLCSGLIYLAVPCMCQCFCDMCYYLTSVFLNIMRVHLFIYLPHSGGLVLQHCVPCYDYLLSGLILSFEMYTSRRASNIGLQTSVHAPFTCNEIYSFHVHGISLVYLCLPFFSLFVQLSLYRLYSYMHVLCLIHYCDTAS
jgi:hypothetical protein